MVQLMTMNSRGCFLRLTPYGIKKPNAHQDWDHDDHGGPQTVPSEFIPQFFLINGKTEQSAE